MFKKLKYLLPFISSFLGSLGGQGTKEWRRIVLPSVLSIIGIICLESWYGILLGMSGIFFSIGYGQVSDNDDDGSVLGRFFWKLTNKNKLLSNILTRGVIAIGICLTTLIVPILTNNWIQYCLGCLSILLGQTIFSYQNLGIIKYGDKELLWSDLANYGLMGLGYLVMLS